MYAVGHEEVLKLLYQAGLIRSRSQALVWNKKKKTGLDL